MIIRMASAFFITATLLLAACMNGQFPRKDTRKEREQARQQFASKEIDSVVNGLSNSYILVVEKDQATKKDLLLFFGKDDAQYLKDSLQYKAAARNFFLLDSTLLPYLLSFEHDTDLCSMICVNHPHSSTLKECASARYACGTVLLYDFFRCNEPGMNCSITTEPPAIEKILRIHTLTSIKKWLDNTPGSLTEKKTKFRMYSDSLNNAPVLARNGM